jgi:hypothetical protein
VAATNADISCLAPCARRAVCHLAEALIKWDVASLRGKTFVSANLKLNITSTSADGQFAFFRVNRPSTETGAS